MRALSRTCYRASRDILFRNDPPSRPTDMRLVPPPVARGSASANRDLPFPAGDPSIVRRWLELRTDLCRRHAPSPRSCRLVEVFAGAPNCPADLRTGRHHLERPLTKRTSRNGLNVQYRGPTPSCMPRAPSRPRTGARTSSRRASRCVSFSRALSAPSSRSPRSNQEAERTVDARTSPGPVTPRGRRGAKGAQALAQRHWCDVAPVA